MTIKLHAFLNEDDGTESCDYRGKGELTGEHVTLAEKEFGPSVTTNEDIEQVIADGPALNRLFQRLSSGGIDGPLAAMTGNKGLRIGVFDH